MGRNLAQVAAPAPLGVIMKFLIINLMLTKTEMRYDHRRWRTRLWMSAPGQVVWWRSEGIN
jgi:hypothetical protein